MEIGTKIKQLRFKAGLTQDQLATKLGISAQSVSKWETLITMPDISLLPMIAGELGVSIDELFDLTAEQKKEVDEIRSREYEFKYRLCCTGTINTRKGHLYIIEALHMLNTEKLANIHVDFLGEGPQKVVLEDLVRRYGLEKHVNFYGTVPNVEVYRHLG